MGDSSSESSIEDFSGIEQPPLLEQLKIILDEYRNDVQIIKELVQNADDAEASVMKVLYDGRTLNEEHPNEKKYRIFLRAPALAFYNDAMFTDADWKGIKSIYSSVKKEDPLKIGRFGLGFKSVFHLTDYPCIISGKNVLFINPHEKQSGKVCVTVKLKNLRKWKRLNIEDFVIAIDGTFGFSEKTLDEGHYPGTMFWFPLRQTPSALSEDVYKDADVQGLLQAFISESHRSLIFLKTICNVEIFVNLQASTQNDISSPKRKRRKMTRDTKSLLDEMNFGKVVPFYGVRITNTSNDLERKRTQILKELKQIGEAVPNESKYWVHDVFVTATTKTLGGNDKMSKARWLIVNYLKGGEISERIHALKKDKDLLYPHLVGLAAPIVEDGSYSSTAGHVFCYQPLPQESSSVTGLPVHVNAFFALTQNRRHIRWPDDDNQSLSSTDKKIEWNLRLLSEIFPDAYGQLVSEMVKLSKAEKNKEYLRKALYNTIPSFEATQPHWRDLANDVLKLCLKQRKEIFYTKSSGNWIPAEEAVIPYGTCCSTAEDLLLKDKVNVCKVPDHVVSDAKRHFPDLKFMTPMFVRQHLVKSPSYKQLSFDKKQDLLELVLQESSTKYLNVIELMPLADSTHCTFSGTNPVFDETEDVISIFPGHEARFLSTDLRQDIRERLKAVSFEGNHCIQTVNADAAKEMLHTIIASKFKTSPQVRPKSAERWKPWIQQVWTFIQTRFKQKCKVFSDLELFPVLIQSPWDSATDFHMNSLRGPFLHIKHSDVVKKEDKVREGLALLSITCVKHVPDWIDKGFVQHFVHDSIADSLSQTTDDNVRKYNENCTVEVSDAVLTYFSERIHTELSTTCKERIRNIKLFKARSSSKDFELVSLKENNKILDTDGFPVNFPAKLIVLQSDLEKRFAKTLGGEIVCASEIAIDALLKFDSYSAEEQKRLVSWIIKNDKVFANIPLQEQLKKTHFLHSADNKLHKPSDLFDPTDKFLVTKLFHNQNLFPVLKEDDPVFIKRLQTLGLKTRDQITSADIEQQCSIVHEMSSDETKFDTKKCVALLKIMNEKYSLVKKEHILSKRCIFALDKVDLTSTLLTVKTHDKASLLRYPTEVKSVDFSSLISSVLFTIDTRTLPHLSKVFGWSEPPKVADVVNHLFNIVKNYDQKKKANCLHMVTEVYEWLKSQKQCSLEEVKAILNDVFSAQEAKYVWVGNGFQPPDKVFVTKKEGDIEMSPFLFELPSEMQGLSEFFIALGCCRYLDFSMHIQTLEEIKIDCEKETKTRICLDRRALALAIDILNKIKNDFLDDLEGNAIEVVFPVRVKDGSLKLEPAKRCTYCDAQWLQDMIEDDIIEVHPDVPIATAEALGVPSLRQQLLSNAEAFEEWGQEEPLTRRLRTLLKEGYVDGFSVAKELFQNADDAGAKKLWILYDERENNDAKTHLLSDNMVKWQGPAIWAFNDALFTAEDLKNITKLSGATKGNDTTKIGKFGLGFCAVYNLTDVPSFISGENLVIFDPHTTFLGKALPGKSPGLRINFRLMKNSKMLNRMKNQFKPFEGVFDCKIIGCSPNFPGTLFRLPLRACGSEISDTVYTPSEVIDLLQKIMKLSSNMLLFNQNVTEIKIFHLPKNVNDPSQRKLLFEAEKAVQTLLSTGNRLFHSQLEEASNRKRNNQLDSPYLSFQQNTIKGKRFKNTQFQQKKSSFSNTWLVSWATGSSKLTLKMTKEEEGALCLGAVAVPIKLSKSDNKDCQEMQVLRLQEVEAEFYTKGHVFFFLPLPIEHSFLFHINGQFGITPDRRHLNTSTEDDRNTKMKDWNECLLSDPVILALLHLLENMHKVGELPGYRFYQLWPMFETGQLLKCVPEAFYRHIVRPGAFKVFERDGKWFDITECVFIERTFRRSSVGEIAFQTLSMLTKYVVDVTEDIYNLMEHADGKLVSENTVNEQRFFLEFFFPNLAQFDTDGLTIVRNKLLCYAICQNNFLLNNWLRNNPSIPSLPTGERKRPCELVNPTSQLKELFEEADGRFPDKTFDSDIVIKHLKDLGLIHDILPDDLVIDRAESVETVSLRCKVCAAIRSGLLISYLSSKQDCHQNCFSMLRQVKFIPVKSKPRQPPWPFVWKGGGQRSTENSRTTLCHPVEFKRLKPSHFDKASNVFHSDCKYLVGCLHYIFEERFCLHTKFSATPQEVKHTLNRTGMQAILVGQVAHALVLEQLQTLIATKVTNMNKSEFESTMKHIYKYLDDKCKQRKDKGEIEMIITSLRRNRSVWVTDQFVSPDIVAEYCPTECQPYLFGLRQSLLFKYKHIVQCIDIVKYFAPKFIGKKILSIKQTKGENILTSEEVSTVISLLKYLQRSLEMDKIYHVDKILDDELPCVYGPDEHGVLRNCKSMCFNDFDGMKKSESMLYAHGYFPPELAKRFGVQPKVIFNLEENSEDVEDFFQYEPLITRLKRLVEGYPCDSGIFKELIQNADDARATEIHFLLDRETHPCNNIFTPEFAPLQGPALCVFNNSAFSNEDLNGITRLGEGSKGDDPSKTGRYGVGFNSVYNITDAPSFYTIGGDIENGETLCFFDPTARYIPNVTKKRPGKRFKNVSDIKIYLGDVMAGYHAGFFMDKPGEKGTIFRLPLRTSESEIKSEPVDVASINGHIDKFCKEAQDMLVFLKYLRTIVVSENVKRERIYEYREVFRVQIDMQSDEDTRVKFVQAQNILCKDRKAEKAKVMTYQQQSFKYEMEMTIKNAKLNTTDSIKYVVVQTVGFKEPERIPDILKQNILKGNIGLLPHGGVALCTSASWPRKLDPANTPTKAYCFLPLPLYTGLPVHIHGYFALDHEVRRSLYKDEYKDSCPKTLWNSTLIRQVISPAYAILLQHAKFQLFLEFAHSTSIYRSVLERLTLYQHLFPNLEDLTDEYWKEILKGVFDVLVSECIPFLPVLRTTLQPSRYIRSGIATRLTNLSWTPLHLPGCIFPAYFKAESGIDDKDNKKSDFNNILRDVGMRIVDCGHIIRSALKYSGHKLQEVEPKDVTHFIASFNSENNCLIKTDQQIDQSVLQTPRNLQHLLEFCLQDLYCFISVIHNLPLFLTQDCVLSTLPQQGFFYVEKSGKFSDLFPSKLNTFLHSEISPLIAGKVPGYEQKSQSKLKEFSLQQCVILITETGATQNVCNYIMWDKQTPCALWVQRFWEYFYQLVFGFDREMVSSQLKMLGDLALIPAKDSQDQQILVAPGNRNILLDIGSFSVNGMLHKAFLQLRIPEIDKTLLKPGVLHMLLDQIPRFERAVDVVESLHFNIDAISKAALSQDQARCIVRYFDVNLDTISLTTGTMLKRLPLFISHFGRIVSLTSYTIKAVVPNNLPKFGLEDLATNASVLLLQDIGSTQLFRNLGIPSFTLEKVYTNFIVPNQEKLQRNDFYEHVRFIAGQWYDIEDAAELISMLRNTKFVKAANGRHVFVRELFDPSVKVFQHFCGPAELVPTELRSAPVLALFKRLGMTTEMNMKLFERFAKDIENTGLGEGLTEAVHKSSELLTSVLFKMRTEFFQMESFTNLCNIRFVLPLKPSVEMTSICEAFNNNQLICFKGSLLESKMNTCWTVASILSKEASPSSSKSDLLTTKLQIERKTRVQDLITHLKNVGENVKVKEKLPNVINHDFLKTVFEDILQAMDDFRNTDELQNDFLKILENVPIIYIPAIKQMLLARVVVLECKDNEQIQPYLNKCPDEFIKYKELFLRLGARKELSCEAYVSVLSALTIHCGDSNILLPKGKIDGVKAMSMLFHFLSLSSEEITISQDCLYLVSNDYKLQKAVNLIAENDSVLYKTVSDNYKGNRVWFLLDITQLDECNLRKEIFIDTLNRLPQNHRPRLLTDIVKSRILLKDIKLEDGTHAQHFEEFLHSRSFFNGFIRLVRHASKDHGDTWSIEEERRIASHLENVRFKHASGIKTILVLTEKINEEPVNEVVTENSQEEKNVHLEENSEGVCVYFNIRDDKWLENVKTDLSIYLNEFIQKRLKDKMLMTLREIIGVFENSNQVRIILSKEKIPEYESNIEVKETPLHPKPGTFVPREFQKYLDNDYGVFYPYEYKFIALELDDPAFEEKEESGDEENDVNIEFSSTYIFVHILEKIEPENTFPLLQDYKIDDGSEIPRTVKAFKLFKFINKIENTNTERGIVLYTGTSSPDKIPDSLKAAYAEVRKFLLEAWAQPENVRKLLIKRLLFKWHPDKNPDKVSFCTKVFQFIQQCLHRLEKGLDLPEVPDDDVNRDSGESGESWNWSSSWYGRYWQRYKRHNRYNRDEYDAGSSSRDRSFRFYGFGGSSYSSHNRTESATKTEPYHWYSEGRRWQRQAESDYSNSRLFLQSTPCETFNWVCYKVHQAVEKSLKAAWYAKDANQIHNVEYSHNITSIASGLGSDLGSLACSFSNLVGDHSRMRYPDMYSGYVIPAEAFSRQTAESAIQLARQILDKVQKDFIR